MSNLQLPIAWLNLNERKLLRENLRLQRSGTRKTLVYTRSRHINCLLVYLNDAELLIRVAEKEDSAVNSGCKHKKVTSCFFSSDSLAEAESKFCRWHLKLISTYEEIESCLQGPQLNV